LESEILETDKLEEMVKEKMVNETLKNEKLGEESLENENLKRESGCAQREITESARLWTLPCTLDQENKFNISAAGRRWKQLEAVCRGHRFQTGTTDLAPGVETTSRSCAKGK